MSGQQHESIASVTIGFILAVANHIFGWFNDVFILVSDGLLSQGLQAIFTGFIGATTAFFANKFWKYIDKKIKSKKEFNDIH